MKWNTRAKLTATATSALLFTLLLAGCTSNNNNNNNVQLPDNNQTQQEQTQAVDEPIVKDSETDQPDVTQSEDNDKNDNNDGQAPTKEVEKITVHEVEGTYIGAIDSHSIEVTVNGTATVFQLEENFQHVISEYPEQAKVKISYEQRKSDGNYEQNVITDISLVK